MNVWTNGVFHLFIECINRNHLCVSFSKLVMKFYYLLVINLTNNDFIRSLSAILLISVFFEIWFLSKSVILLKYCNQAHFTMKKKSFKIDIDFSKKYFQRKKSQPNANRLNNILSIPCICHRRSEVMFKSCNFQWKER